MAAQTIAQRIAALEADLAAVKAQITAATTAPNSFTLGDMSASGGYVASYASLTAERARLEKALQRLYRGGRGIQIDMSAGTSDSADPFRSGSEVLL